MNTIGERIIFLRERQGISQKELARQLGITAATLSRYENNLYDPKGEIIVRLSNSLQTSADYLLGITSDYRMPKKSNDLPEREIFFWVQSPLLASTSIALTFTYTYTDTHIYAYN